MDSRLVTDQSDKWMTEKSEVILGHTAHEVIYRDECRGMTDFQHENKVFLKQRTEVNLVKLKV